METVLLIDNYDSFVFNLARYVVEVGAKALVFRNDAISLEQIEQLDPAGIIVSPGPRTPNEAGISNTAIQHFGERIPILGVCLGHQCIGQVYGGQIQRAIRPMHGKATQIQHDGSQLFTGLPNPLSGARYHSLIVAEEGLPDDLVITACSTDSEIMGLRHRHFPVFGVQFHPESVLTEHGHAIIRNFISIL